MPFVIFRTRSRDRSQLPLPGRFLIRRWLTPCITEFEPRTAKQYKCHYCCVCKKIQRKGDGGWRRKEKKKCFCIVSQMTRDDEFVLFLFLVFIFYCLLPDTVWLRAFKYAFKDSTVNFANWLSPPSIVKTIRTGRKKRPSGHRLVKVKGVNNPAWTAQ